MGQVCSQTDKTSECEQCERESLEFRSKHVSRKSVRVPLCIHTALHVDLAKSGAMWECGLQ